MNLFGRIGVFAIILWLFAEYTVGNLINLSLRDKNLLNSLNAQFEENFIYGEVNRIPYAQFTKHSFKPPVTTADELFKLLVANENNIKLSIYYRNSWLDVSNIKPTIVTDNEEIFFGFGFQLKPFRYKQAILQADAQYIGHFEESTSELIFFETVNGKQTFEALTHFLTKNEVFHVQFSGSSYFAEIKKSALINKPLNSTHGSGLFLTFTRQVYVYSSSHSIGTFAVLRMYDSVLEFETSNSTNLLERIKSCPWLIYNFFPHESAEYRIIPTISASSKPNETNETFTLSQYFIPSVMKCSPNAVEEYPASRKKGEKIVFSTADPQSKTLAFIYEDNKRIEIYSNVNIGTLQKNIRESCFGYCQDISGYVKTVIPEEKFDIDPAKDPRYNYLKFSFEPTVKVATLKETLIGKITRETAMRVFGSKETLQNVKTAANNSQQWTIMFPDETTTIVTVKIDIEPLSIKDMFYMDVSYSKLS